LATPCFASHKKEEKWNFREIGKLCIDCHPDLHKSYISTKFYPNNSCNSCHAESKWSDVNFDHSKTDFALNGVHANTACRACHFVKATNIPDQQRFSGLSKSCTNCHTDHHFKQFDVNGSTDCNRCHGNENWKAVNFNHNNTAFKLDGKHQNVPCAKCHKPQTEEKYIVYKIKEFKCESCHSQ